MSGQLPPTERLAVLGAASVALVLALSALTPAISGPPSDPTLDRLAIAARQRDEARIVYPADHSPVLALSDGRTQTVHSVLNVGRMLSYGDYVWNDAGIASGPVFIRVDLSRQLISVFRGADEIGTAIVLFGANGKSTPRGTLTILAKDEDHYSRSYDAPMPYMLRLTADGVAIHASDVRAAHATHGCIGVPTGFARQLFGVAGVGDTVDIVATNSPREVRQTLHDPAPPER